MSLRAALGLQLLFSLLFLLFLVFVLLLGGAGKVRADVAAVGDLFTSVDSSTGIANAQITWRNENHDVLGVSTVNLGSSVGTSLVDSTLALTTSDPITGSAVSTSSSPELSFSTTSGSFVCDAGGCAISSSSVLPLETLSGSVVGPGPSQLPPLTDVRYVVDSFGVCVPVGGPINECTGTSVLNATPVLATPTGTNVEVAVDTTFLNPITGTEEPVTIDVTFDNVSAGGTTAIQPLSTADGEIPANLVVSAAGFQAIFFDVSSDAIFSGDVSICSDYADATNDGLIDGSAVDECDLRLLHREAGVFIDRTTLGSSCPLTGGALTCPGVPGAIPCIDTSLNRICAQVSSFSPFVVAAIAPPPNATPALGTWSVGLLAALFVGLGASRLRKPRHSATHC